MLEIPEFFSAKCTQVSLPSAVSLHVPPILNMVITLAVHICCSSNLSPISEEKALLRWTFYYLFIPNANQICAHGPQSACMKDIKFFFFFKAHLEEEKYFKRHEMRLKNKKTKGTWLDFWPMKRWDDKQGIFTLIRRDCSHKVVWCVVMECESMLLPNTCVLLLQSDCDWFDGWNDTRETPAGNVGTRKAEGARRQLWSTITSSSPVCSPGVVWDVRCLAGLLLADHLWRPAFQVRRVRLLRKDWHQPERCDKLSLVPCALPRCDFASISNHR